MQRTRFLLVFLLGIALCVLVASQTLADVIYKTDGSRVKGKIVKESDEFVWVKTRYGTVKVDKFDIDRIEHGDDEEKPDPEPKKITPPEAEKPVVEKVKKPVKPQEPKKPVDEPAPKSDKLMSEDNLNKLRRICEDRMKAYQGVPWGNAHKFPVNYGNRKVFDVSCNSTKKVAKHYAWLMGKLYTKYCKVFAAFKPKTIVCRIEIYRNYTEFRRLKRMPPGVGGFYRPGRHVLCAFHGTMGTLNTTGVLAHEGCHLFQDLFLSRFQYAPIWVLEGMATLMEAAKIEKDGKIHIRGVSSDRLAHLQSMIRGGSSIPLGTVMSTPQRSFRAQHYAHAGMFTFWLIKGSKKKKLAYLYNDYLKIAAGGTTSGGKTLRPQQIRTGDFQRLCGEFKLSLSKLEEQWKKWVLKSKVERPGKVVGSKFICDEYGFEVSAPGPGWKIDTKDVHGRELCVMKHKDIEGRISVSMGGTFGTPNLDEFLAMVDSMREQQIAKLTRYKRISRERKKFMAGLDGWDGVSEYADPESAITKDFKRRRGISISMVDTLYTFGCMVDPDKFDDFQQYFDKVLASFRLDANKLD